MRVAVRRSRGRVALAVVFALLSLNALAQVFVSDDPPTLTVLQALIGVAGGAAAWGSWAAKRGRLPRRCSGLAGLRAGYAVATKHATLPTTHTLRDEKGPRAS